MFEEVAVNCRTRKIEQFRAFVISERGRSGVPNISEHSFTPNGKVRTGACRQFVERLGKPDWDVVQRKKDQWLIAGRLGKWQLLAVSTTPMDA